MAESAGQQGIEAAGNAGTLPRLFRVVFHCGSGVRLQSRPQDPPASLRVELDMPTGDAAVLIRDLVDGASGLPVHEGLELQVVISGADLDEAVTRGRQLASLYCAALSAASRAWVNAPDPMLAYEITSGAHRRAFRQWHRDVPLPTGKTPVPQLSFGPMHTRLIGLPETSVDTRLIQMAIEFYTGAMREVEPILRFMLLWPAAEALDAPLRRRLTQVVPDQRHWGLKACARQRAIEPKLVDDAYDLRSDLVHVRPGRSTRELLADAQEIGDQLEGLVVAALCLALDVPEAQAALPLAAGTGHRVEVIVDAEIEGDPAGWAEDHHPRITGRYKLEPIKGSDPPQATLTPTFKAENCDRVHAPGISVWGPLGPNSVTMEFSSAKVTRADGTEEPVTPDPA
jgi:hypothetical protein